MNTKTIVIFMLVTLGVLLGVGLLLWQFGGAGVTATSTKPIANIAGNLHHTKGSGNVTLVEFSDFQCPACQAVENPLDQLLTKYNGKITFVYRYFPLTNIHKNAQIAAQAAEAAGLQGKFWEYHDALFAQHTTWEDEADPRPTLVALATGLGMNGTQFSTDMSSQTVTDAVATDETAAAQDNLQGTPTFFVNGVETDFSVLDAKLAQLTQ